MLVSSSNNRNSCGSGSNSSGRISSSRISSSRDGSSISSGGRNVNVSNVGSCCSNC